MASETYVQHDISGQVVVITGASSGIGEATARRLAETGCKLVLTARRRDRLVALKNELQDKYRASIHTVVLDVTDQTALEKFAEDLPEEYKEVDILVNNAGLALGTSPVHEINAQDAVLMVTTNVTALALLTRHLSPGMVKRNRGHIVNISSIAAHHAYPGGSIYCGTKHFVDAFTNAARHDLVGTQVRVTSISPGAVETEFSIVRYGGDKDKAAAVYEGIDPLTAADCADNVLYAITRPLHVQIGEIIVYATNQASPQNIARAKRGSQK